MILVIGNKNYSSWSLSPWFLLTHLQVEFEEIRLPLDTECFRVNIRNYSPTDKVPALRDGELAVWDSWAILEYLADKYPEHNLWSENRTARAYARSVCAELHSGFHALQREMPMNCRAKNRYVQPSGNAIKDIARIQAIWNTCRPRWDHLGPWLLGQFSIADAMFVPVASRFRTYNVNLGSVAQAWCDMVLDSNAYKLWTQAAVNEREIILAEEVGMKR